MRLSALATSSRMSPSLYVCSAISGPSDWSASCAAPRLIRLMASFSCSILRSTSFEGRSAASVRRQAVEYTECRLQPQQSQRVPSGPCLSRLRWPLS